MLRLRAYLPWALILLFIAAIVALYSLVSPDEIIDAIGVTNAYFVAFLIAVLGGISSFTGVAFYSSLATFAAGGASPLLLALFGGMGIFISDSIFYLLAYHGHQSIPERWRRRLDRLFAWIKEHPRSLVLFFSYLYLGIAPLPSDLLMLVLVLSGYSYRTVAPVLLASGITLALIAATVGYAWL